MMVARATSSHILPRTPLKLLVSDLNTVNENIRLIQSNFESNGYEVSLCSLLDLPSTSTDIVALLDIESSKPFFQDLSESYFNGLSQLIRQSSIRGSKILWLTGSGQVGSRDPHHAMILGLARTLRLELGSVFATLELEATDLSTAQWKSVAQLLHKLQAKGGLAYSTMDYEYAFVGGNVCIPRFVTSSVDGMLCRNLESRETVKRLFISNPGALSSLQWGLQARAKGLQDNEIEIEVRTASLNSWASISYL